MTLQILSVLMWKHLVVRLKRFIHTPVEILSPIIFFVILFSFKDYIYPVPRSHQVNKYNEQNHEPVSLAPEKYQAKLFYTPDNDLTNALMKEVGPLLKLENFSGESQMTKSYYKAFTNESDIPILAETMNVDDAIIIFPDMNTTWPKKLRYTIRMKSYFYTETYKSEEVKLEPRENFGTVYSAFMKLQWAIDSSYIKLVSGKTVPQEVLLQEFPFVRTTGNEISGMFNVVLPILCYFSLLLVFVFLTVRLLEERINGIQELIRMVGVSSNLLNISHFLNVLPAGLAYCLAGTVLLTASDHPYVAFSSPGMLFTVLILHFTSVVSMAYAGSYLVKTTQYTVTIAITLYVAFVIPVEVLMEYEISQSYIPLTGLLPHVPMVWFWRELAILEQYGSGVTMETIGNVHGDQNGSVLLSFIMLVVQSAIFFSIAWYLARVNPGPYGTALPWNFLCLKQYWMPSKVQPGDRDEEMEEVNVADAQYFEPAPKNAEIGIRIENVTKIFGKQRALDNVSLDVYKGEITVLLGHNGAGKTTLMSIITGMYSASEGNVFVEGMQSVAQRDEMRKLLGLCPQHNLFFPDLTVLQHVMFFTMLKGTSYSEAKTSSKTLLARLGLGDKLSTYSSQLSGGMKRRLQLACALAGEAKVLVLDEPTSGLDVETRRELWDLLLSLRGSRTVLISTHFMEEAEALGDRVAALHGGKLRCHATTMHLKRALGTGYRLTFTTTGLPNEPAISAAIVDKVPEATVKERSLNSISYNLPSKSSNKFPTLFNTLESKRSELGIESIGVGISTLEEVFLKLCSDVKTTFDEDDIDGETSEPIFEKLSGVRLYAHQLLMLVIRQFKFLWSKKMTFLLLQAFLPIVMICSLAYMSNSDHMKTYTESPAVNMNLDLYNGQIADRRVLYSVNETGLRQIFIGQKYKFVDFKSVPNVEEAMLRIGRKNILDYKNYLVGSEINDTHAKVLYTTLYRHAAPVSLNLLSNMIAGQMIPYAVEDTITTINHPLSDRVHPASSNIRQPKDKTLSLIWAVGIVFITLCTIINGVVLPCKERASGSRHIHVMTGCPPALHWAATLLAHLLTYAVVLLLPIIITAAAIDKDHTIDQPEFLGVLTLVLLLGCMAYMAFMYLVSCALGERGANILLAVCVILFSIITPIMKVSMSLLEIERKGVTYVLVTLCGYLLPPHTFTMAVGTTVHNAGLQAYCVLNRDMCGQLTPIPGFDLNKCCVQKVSPVCYFCIDKYTPAEHMLILLFQFIVYMTLVVLIEHGVLNSLCDRVFNAAYAPAAPATAHEAVRSEKAYVDKAIKLPSNQIQDAMLVSDVHKKYWKLCGKGCNAVRGIDFSVKRGEVFGLLGVNGAGKSSTFKMLTGVECPTRGTIFANGHFSGKNSSKYLQSLGYCPQFFGLDDFLSGYDNLALLLTLRGLSPRDVEAEANTWIEIVGLQQYARRPVQGYSGGCARRVAAAAALCCGAAVTLLDEPTAGVDVAARRRVWAAVRRAARARSLVITSHSMDEMEALCGRIAIMSGGRVVALGEAAALRAAHAAGHAVLLKLTTRGDAQDVTDGSKTDVARLKATLHQKFNCTLRDEHTTMLHYHINETMRYSDLFSELEHLRNEFPDLLEDYSVTETTLEEVFLSFAKAESQQEPVPVAV
ncbi:phospholipid-transporting ATPase ABCA1 [Bicyclus anynana]|uniref:Phospholipid-transporting ATPase ABCA1 n=1 Tax=Bicyclus anynana TaxID=110368 RepID=A0ABM3LXL2_BICAN|nr:phospholipid-transporting ATPase ABCA1 [Bicyclus anynana]XP_052743811.1 phospholipid-transporting ATPase ABCA1 [Bicyclus anynana]XP_052743812.1 phospholipid-transporting ATPase ABCA1 [Bicyclus anynana]XP_052743813.1 phospholipid-transporting ATPase ABCA1 [Bicyclus anynana]XP_052743814.1 phospholipid-transporting ATPase ABCA1 [Bicyclus anynana]XP_052743815.1 phospholipid-transporting ATPase ABCA1 [Bicyclus anynana]XP_052743816.1 phospholipid-transporting ATPase ABCA1 [Bicyclus anynana]XP_0